MSDISDREKIFRRDVGVASTVQRETISQDKAALPNRALCDLGLSLNPIPDNLAYRGSAAVHIYWNATLQQVFYVSQTAPLELYKCPEPLAIKAFDDLLGVLKEMYGHKRPKLRSGF
jgi:hypothetical protein